MKEKFINYKKIKEIKYENRNIYPSIYRKVSTPFTFLFANMGITPTSISIISYIPLAISPFLFLSSDKIITSFGFLAIVAYKILDCCDGEVARLNSVQMTKDREWSGILFDVNGHFIESIAYGMGIGLTLLNFYQLSIIYGIFLTILLNIEFSSKFVLKYYHARMMIEKNVTTNNFKQRENDMINKTYNSSIPNIIRITFSKEMLPLLLIPLLFIGKLAMFSYLILFSMIKLIDVIGFLISIKIKHPLNMTSSQNKSS